MKFLDDCQQQQQSTLAMDTLYAEGKRHYVESLSSYACQFLGVHKRLDVDRHEIKHEVRGIVLKVKYLNFIRSPFLIMTFVVTIVTPPLL